MSKLIQVIIKKVSPERKAEVTNCKKDSVQTSKSSSSKNNLNDSLFSKPLGYTDNVVFQVEGHLVHVSKVIVCASSRVFDVMLDGNFSEKDKEIIPLPDDSYDDFIDLMTIIHPPLQMFEFMNNKIEGLVHLADKYQMSVVLKLCEDCLLDCTNPTVESLAWAQKYELNRYIAYCIATVCKTTTKREIMSDKNGLFITTQIEVIKARALLFEKIFNRCTYYYTKKTSDHKESRNLQDLHENLFKRTQTAKTLFRENFSSTSKIWELNFSRPWKWNDVIVKVQGHHIHACKPVLCYNSTVLRHMLDNAANEEIHIKDNDFLFLDFIDLMSIIHPPMKLDVLTGTNVHAIARLANKYDMRGVVDLCEVYMMQDDTGYTYQTLLTAQQCHMTELLQHCADSLSRHQTVNQIINNSEFSKLDNNTVLTLLAKRVERFEDLFEQGTVYISGNKYNIENWHTYPYL